MNFVYDMIHGIHTSSFGWDDNRHTIVAEDEVWNAHIQVSCHLCSGRLT